MRPGGPAASRGMRIRRSWSALPPVALLAPGVAVHVVAVLFPEARGVGGAELDAADPLGALPEVQARHEAAEGPAVVGGEVLAVPRVGEDAVFAQERVQRDVHGEPGLAVAHDEPRLGPGPGLIDDGLRGNPREDVV